MSTTKGNFDRKNQGTRDFIDREHGRKSEIREQENMLPPPPVWLSHFVISLALVMPYIILPSSEKALLGQKKC